MLVNTDMNSLIKRIDNCSKCKLCKYRNNIVFGKGNMNADIMLIAEAPGYEEDKTGIPFMGRSGKIIDEALEVANITRNDVYITNIVKCRPPKNRNPIQEEINTCIDYLRNEVYLVKPKVIILLGGVPLKEIIGKNYFITKVRGTLINKNNILYLPTYHPAAVLRDSNKKMDFINDFIKATNVK